PGPGPRPGRVHRDLAGGDRAAARRRPAALRGRASQRHVHQRVAQGARTTTIRRVAAALLSLVAVAALAGCTTPGAVKKACGTEADLIDTTGSTAGFRGQWPAE